LASATCGAHSGPRRRKRKKKRGKEGRSNTSRARACKKTRNSCVSPNCNNSSIGARPCLMLSLLLSYISICPSTMNNRRINSVAYANAPIGFSIRRDPVPIDLQSIATRPCDRVILTRSIAIAIRPPGERLSIRIISTNRRVIRK